VSIGLSPPATVSQPAPHASRSLWSDAWRRLRRNRVAIVSGAFLLLVCALAGLSPWLPFLRDPALQELRLGATPSAATRSPGSCMAGASRCSSGSWGPP
jgi:hypothetical protein